MYVSDGYDDDDGDDGDGSYDDDDGYVWPKFDIIFGISAGNDAKSWLKN